METSLSVFPVTYLSRILAVLMAIILVSSGSSAQGLPSATPVSDGSPGLSGSISLVGWDGVTEISFQVIDANGVILDSGVISTNPYESDVLVSTPRNTATLSILNNSIYTETIVTTVANENGELHFDVVLEPHMNSSSSIQSRSSISESDQLELDILYTISLTSSITQQPLSGHLVTVVDASGIEASVRSDISGNAVFSLLPGIYDVRIDPYGAHAGLDLTIEVAAESRSTFVTLAWLQASGSLRVRANPILDGQPLVRVFNGAGLMIGEAPLADPAGVLFDSLAFGENYIVQIDGNETYRRATLEPFDFWSSQVVEVPMVPRPLGKATFILSTSDGSTLPEEVQITATNEDWIASGVAKDSGDGIWMLTLEVMRGEVSYEIHADGYESLSGTAVVSSNTQIRPELFPIVAQPTPTVVPSPTPEPTAVPSPTPEPTVVPSPTPEPTAVPSPTPEPTAVPSPTPEPTVVPSPTPEPTAVPSPTPEPTAIPSHTPEPTVVPSPTPEPTAVPSPTPEPTAIPSHTPEPTAVPSPTPEPTAVPSPTPEPTAIPSPTPEPTAVPSPTPEPTVIPSPTPEPTAVPSPTPEPTAIPSPTPEPTVVPSPTPEPTVVPSPTPEPTAVPSPTPEPTVVPSPTPEPTAIPSPTPTVVPSPTPEPTVVPSPTPEPTVVPSPTPEPTAIPSPTPEPTAIPSPTPEPTAVPSPTPEPTFVPSPTPEPTAIPSPTPEPTAVPSPTPEPTAVPSPTPELTAVPSPTPEPTAIPSPTPEPTAVPSPTPEPTAVPSPTPEPTAIPSPTPEPTTVPSPTPEPTAVPSPTPSTQIPDNDGRVVTAITFETRGESVLEGAPYDLYAPAASQSAIQPYLSGIVGPGNRIELVDLPVGQYRLVVRPSGLLPVELMIVIGLTDTEIVLPVEPTLTESVSVPIVPVGLDQQTRADADPEPISGASNNVAMVTGLPSTGASTPTEQGHWSIVTAAVILMAMLSAGLAWKRTNEQ